MKKPALRLLLPLLLLLSARPLAAQVEVPVRTSPGAWSLSAAWQYGFIIAHRSSLIVLQQDHVKSLELAWFRQTHDPQGWPRVFRYPGFGFRYFYMDLGNGEALGKAHALMVSLDFTLAESDRVSFHLGTGIGLSYLTKTFERVENHKNVAIGSAVNGTICLAAECHVRAAPRTYVTAGLHFNHMSNAAVTTPNLGYNIPMAKVGLRRYFGTPRPLRYDSILPYPRKFRHTVTLAAAVKQEYPVNGPDYYVVAASAASVRRISHKSAVGLGVDVQYDNSLLYKLSTDAEPDPPKSKAVRAGVNLSYELIFSRFSMMVQAGRYLYNPLTDEGMLYQRLSLRYECWRQWFVCTSLKVHIGKADFVDLGIGKRF